MEDKLSGRRTSSREGHQLNADSPILSSFLQFDKSTEARASQLENAVHPISFRCGGHTTSSKDLHILNKLSGNFERSLQAEKSMFLILQP